MNVRLAILGPVEVSSAGHPLPGLAPRHRAVLAYLLLHAGTVVSAERLTGAVWGEDPPATARAQVHAAVTAIRRALRPAGAAGLLASRAGGYVISPEDRQFDLAEFTGALAEAQRLAEAGELHDAAGQFRAALGLWRGQPLADVTAGFAGAARTRLEERRLAAVERLAEVELSLGRHDEVIGELTGLVAEHPLRERLCRELMLALHRAGRQPDALSAGRAYRSALAEQQGLDPSRAFAALEQAILRDDPSLDHRPATGTGTARTGGPASETGTAGTGTARAAGPASGTGTAPAAGHGPVGSGSPGAAPDGPAASGTAPAAASRRVNFLPYDTPDFTGREAELGLLAGPGPHPDPGVTIWLIDGMPGIGKTALAVHAGHRLAGRFPDGQLFVDLQAHTPGREPADPADALENLLRQLGVPADRIPACADDRAALWRSELADRRVLAVLDNASATGQLRPLLPGASRSLILITSRQRLTGIDGGHVLSLDLLPAADAAGVFTRIVGDRADAEPIAVLDVLHQCGFLPLAIRIAAARLQHRPRWTASYLAGRLRDQRRRLAELSAEDRSVAAAFALSYEHLDPAQQRMFRLLGLHPGADFDAQAAAALGDVSAQWAEGLLEALLDAHMLLQREPGRYTFHDLLREHAGGTVSAEEAVDARHAALGRLLEYYARTAGTAADLVFPVTGYLRPASTEPSSPDPRSPETGHPEPGHTEPGHTEPGHTEPGHTVPAGTEPGGPGPFLADAGQAVAWLDAERGNLVAAATCAAGQGWPGHACHLAATLSEYVYDYGHHTDAFRLHTQALRASRQRGDQAAEAQALISLALIELRRGRYRQADEHAVQALGICRSTGDRYGEARARNALGNIRSRQGDWPRARSYFRQALGIYRDIGERAGETHALGNLGIVYEREGRYEEAAGHLRQALELYLERGDQGLEMAIAQTHLGVACRRLGQFEEARSHHRRALEVFRELGNRSEEADARNGLGETAQAMGDHTQAVADHDAALVLAREAGNDLEQGRAHDGLARAHLELGHTALAREHASQAVRRYTRLGVPEAARAEAFLASLDEPPAGGSAGPPDGQPG